MLPSRRTTVSGTEHLSYADVPNRIVACLIDSVLVFGAIFMAAVVVSLTLGPAVRFNPAGDNLTDRVVVDATVMAIDAVVAAFVIFAYLVGSWILVGASPGQRALRLRVTGRATDTPPTVSQAILRWAFLGGPLAAAGLIQVAVPRTGAPTQVLLAAWYLVLLVTTVRSGTKQGLHDRLAGTVVTKPVQILSATGSKSVPAPSAELDMAVTPA